VIPLTKTMAAFPDRTVQKGGSVRVRVKKYIREGEYESTHTGMFCLLPVLLRRRKTKFRLRRRRDKNTVPSTEEKEGEDGN